MRSIKPTGIKFKVESHRCKVIINQNISFIRNRQDKYSLRKQPTFSDATTGFPAKWRVRNERRNSILMIQHVTTQIWVVHQIGWIKFLMRQDRSEAVTRHQYGISALVSQTSLGGKPVVATPNVRCFLRLRQVRR